MTWAHELVVGSRPWDDTSQVSADGVKTVRFKSLVFLNNEVSEINLERKDKRRRKRKRKNLTYLKVILNQMLVRKVIPLIHLLK